MFAEPKRKPVHEFRQGTVKIALWENQSSKGPFLNATISNSYQDDRGWHDTNSFSEHDLEALSLASLEARKKIREFRRDHSPANE